LMVKANAGLPEVVEGKSVFKETPEHFASFTPAFIQRGVRLIGGCCGTHPGFIGRLKEAVKGVTIPPLEEKPAQAIASPYRILSLDGNESHPVGILSLDQGDPQALVEAAREQVLQGAEAICLDFGKGGDDLNVDEIIGHFCIFIRVPVIFKGEDPNVLERFLRIYPGRAGVILEGADGDERASAVRKYGSAVVPMGFLSANPLKD
jgi:hypothetical protein